jgi:hypothetical protein
VREHGRLGPLEWALAARAMPGESVCGDHGVALDAGGAALFGVIDGLGHGAAAALAARRAARVLADNPAEPLDVLLLLCHRALADTRGGAVTLAGMAFDGGNQLRWLAVGNVSAWLIEAAPGGPAPRTTVLLAGGIVGYQLPATLQPQQAPMRSGDLLIMTTDGIRGDFPDSVDLARSAEQIAADVLAAHAKDSDDALVLAARYRGTPP